MPEKKNNIPSLAPLYLIDAYGLIYRSYFAFISRPLRNPAGKNVSALFGFARTLISLLDEGAPGTEAGENQPPPKPLRLAAAFDSPGPTFRLQRYPEYKATRQKAPEDLHAQVPLVEETLRALGVPILRAEGYEADDIIATLARKCREEGRRCYILSSDKDLLQLAGGGTYELRPFKRSRTEAGSRGGYELVGPAEVKAEWGVLPAQVLDLLALTGDSSDNVPGVKGIGEKTAVKLMARYGSLDGIYRNLSAIQGAVGEKLSQGRESAYLSKDLIALNYEVPLPIAGIDDLSVETLDRGAGARILLREGIRQSALALDPLAGEGPRPAPSPPAGPAPEGAGSLPEEGDPALLGEGVYRAITDLPELEQFLARAHEAGLLALDFETDSLDAWNARPIGISLAVRPQEAFYVPVASHGAEGDPGHGVFLDPPLVRDLLAPLLSDPGMTVAAHNAKYDYKVSRGWGLPRWQCRIWDTMVAAWVDDPERNNYSLDSLAVFHFNLSPLSYNDIVPKGSAFDTVPLETAVRYSGEDADLTLRMKRFLEGRLERSGSLALFLNLEMPLLPILAEMEGEGIQVEGQVLRDYGAELSGDLGRIQGETYKIVGHEFNLASTKQLQEVLFVERKLKPGKKTKTGYSTDVAVLEELAQEDPAPALILRYRSLAKLKSTYVDTLADTADSRGRIHTHFVQTGTATGRLSSRDPNLQNIPIRDEEGRRIREAFTAAPGKLLISADYSQIELVILAHLSQDGNLIAAFKEGKDVHARTAALIFGIPEEQVRPAERRIAKTINFGVMYGMSAFRLSNELGITRTSAAAFIEAYFNTYRGIRSFIEDLIKKTETTGYAATILGRRRYIPAINSRNKTEKAAAERVAVNTPIQGSAADIVKTAMLKLDKALTARKSPARLLLQVHDELILEVPEDAAAEAAELVRQEMESAVTLKVPLRVSVETAKRWGDLH
jgi:DNA polymerase-1